MYKLAVLNILTGLQDGVICTEENVLIPFDPANTCYQRYLVWLSEGNTPLPADEVTP